MLKHFNLFVQPLKHKSLALDLIAVLLLVGAFANIGLIVVLTVLHEVLMLFEGVKGGWVGR